MPAACSYLVMCHTDPEGVLRLVRRIRRLSPQAGIVVRHDRPGLFAPGAVEAAGGVPLLSDIRVRWGEWSQVEMQLELLSVAPRLAPAERYVFVSGQDYPIRDLGSWEEELAAEGADAGLQVMSAQMEDHSLRWRVVAEPEVGPAAVRRLVRAAGARLGACAARFVRAYPVTRGELTRWWIGTPRREGAPAPVVKASSWVVVSARGAAAVLRADRERPDVRAFFRSVRTPDEYYLPSLIAASGLRWSHRTVSTRRFVEGAASPAWLDVDILTGCVAAGTEAAFARKVPPDADPAVLRLADELAESSRPR